jgi:hypothetical protein
MNDILHIYTRVSSVIQQEEGTSLENQKQLGIKKATELGFDFRLWNEGGQSSFYDDLSNRPVLVSSPHWKNMKKMMKREVHVFIVMKKYY